MSPDQAARAAWLGAKAAYMGGFDNATAAITAYLTDYPTGPHRYEAELMLANTLLESDLPRALEIYARLDATNPGSSLRPDLRYHYGYALLRMGEFDRSRAMLELVPRDSEFGSARNFYLGYIAYCNRDYNRAVDYFTHTDHRTQPGASADYYLAQIYYVQGSYDKALSAARALIDNPAVADPAFTAEACRIAGESLYNTGHIDRALPYLERYAATTDSPEPGTLYILGTECYNRGDYAKAVKYLTPVTDSDSAMGQSAYLYIGEALMAEGDKDAALMAFDAALRMEHDPKVREAAYYNYAVAKFGGASTPFGSSVATFEDFLRRYPDGPYTGSVQEYLVAGYLGDRDYDTALASIERMTNPGPKVLAAKQQILYALGLRQLSSGTPQAARDYLRQAEALSRYDSAVAAQVQLALGEALYRLEDYKGAATAARRYLDASTARDANRPLGYYDLGYALFAQRDYKAAANAFRKFVDAPGTMTDATVADAYNRLGDAALYDNKFDEATRHYRDSYNRSQSSGDYPLFQQAVISGYRRDYNDKVATIDRLIATFPSSSLIPDALLERAQAYIQLQRRGDAIDTYRTLVEQYPTTSQGRSGYVQLGMTLLADGRRGEAIEAYRRVITDYSTSEEAMVAVEEMQRLAAQDGTLGQFAAFLESIENAPQLDIARADQLTFEAAEEAYLADNATKRLQSYLDEYPTGAYRVQAWNYLMEDATAAGNTGDALTYAALIVENAPDSRTAESALAVKAAAQHSLGQSAQALETWQQLARRASTPAMQNKARAGIMLLARDLGDYDLVIENADALLASSTAGAEDRNEAIFSRALALAQKGDTAGAIDAWQSIASLTDDINGVKSAYYMAQTLFDNGQTDRATEAVEDIIDSATPHTYWLARAFVLLSDIYVAQGKKFEAREYLRSLRENYPGSETDIYQMIDSRLTQLK